MVPTCSTTDLLPPEMANAIVVAIEIVVILIVTMFLRICLYAAICHMLDCKGRAKVAAMCGNIFFASVLVFIRIDSDRDTPIHLSVAYNLVLLIVFALALLLNVATVRGIYLAFKYLRSQRSGAKDAQRMHAEAQTPVHSSVVETEKHDLEA